MDSDLQDLANKAGISLTPSWGSILVGGAINGAIVGLGVVAVTSIATAIRGDNGSAGEAAETVAGLFRR